MRQAYKKAAAYDIDYVLQRYIDDHDTDQERADMYEREAAGTGGSSWHCVLPTQGASLGFTMQAELETLADEPVAVGPHPDWQEDNDTVLSAVVPEPDGSVIVGVY